MFVRSSRNAKAVLIQNYVRRRTQVVTVQEDSVGQSICMTYRQKSDISREVFSLVFEIHQRKYLRSQKNLQKCID